MYLITGASGFIGKRVIGYLKLYRLPFKILSRSYVSSIIEAPDGFPGHDDLSDALADVDTVIHVAGIAHAGMLARIRRKDYSKINTDYPVSLAKAAFECGAKRFIFISSVKAIDYDEKISDNSEADGTPSTSIYGKSKYFAEKELSTLSQTLSMQIIIVRPALVYGPEVKGNLKLLKRLLQLSLLPRLPDTGTKRSMIHVDDLVRCIFFLEKNVKTSGEIFIATDGKGYSAQEVYDNLCLALQKNISKYLIPITVYKICKIFIPGFKKLYNKIFENERYSSKKLQELGFLANKKLCDIENSDY